MISVATLIANLPILDDTVVARVRSTLPLPGAPVWLDRGIAIDIPFTANSGNDNRVFFERVQQALSSLPVDAIIQTADKRRKRLFLADMDSTMIGQECVDELADIVGKKRYVAAITERAMRGEIEFVPALIERVALLAGLPSSVIDEVIAKRITLTPGGQKLVATMRAHGAHTCLVSGGFVEFTAKIAGLIGFDENYGNRLLIDNAGRLTGDVATPIFGRDAKLATLIALRERFHLTKEETLVAGDGANDLAMILEAGLGIAYHAKPTVAAQAHARIDHSDLTALLYAQGYRREEFVGPSP